MATLKAMFKLFDGYSSTINKVVSGTDKAAKSVLGASKNTDKYNDSLKSTGASASTASNGLTKLIGTVATLASVKKTMDLTDTYTNTAARLKMINDGSQTQLELQNKIFAAAGRARGSYNDMASAVAKMNLLAGDSFKSNDEAIGFTELLQKSLKVSGASQGEQDSAFLQLSQAMAAGKLQGDEFRSVMENAPMVAQAIATYTGKTKGELKAMSAEGTITADIIKGAMFAAADDINDKFATMPMTFADVWTKIKNAGSQAFGPVFEKLNQMLNSDGGQQMLNNIVGMIYAAADACDALLDGASAVYNFISNNWGTIGPIIMGIVAILGVYSGAMLAMRIATTLAAAAQFVMNSAILTSPIFWIIAGVIALVAIIFVVANAIAKTTGVASSGFGVITGGINVVIQFFKNLGLIVANIALGIAGAIGAVATNVTISFSNAISSVQSWWYDLLSTVLTVVAGISEALNKLPFVEFDYSGITAAADEYAAKSKEAAGNKKEYTSVTDAFNKGLSTFEVFQDGWATDAFNNGAAWGDGVTDKVSGMLSDIIPDMPDYGSDYGSASNPAVVKGTGSGGSVKVENDDEDDPEWLQALANRDFVARIATNTLAPNVVVNFSGPITQEADVNGIAKHIDNILKEQLAIASEGVYQ